MYSLFNLTANGASSELKEETVVAVEVVAVVKGTSVLVVD